jgi:hygromycin-B 4-O-kinase
VNDPGTVKPDISPSTARQLLEEYFGRPIRDLEVLAGGQVAHTFSFAVDQRRDAETGQYVVRFNAQMVGGFEKEAYVIRNFASPSIPIPRLIQLGRLGDVYYAITEKLPGRNLLDIPRDGYLELIPQQIEILDAIHAVPLDDRPGYGSFDGQGVAPYASWPAYLAGVGEEEPEGGFFGKWHSMFCDTFLERELFERLYGRMMALAKYAPAERSLVHGDYGLKNMLAQDGRITGVLDWMGAGYGDPLYDVAWLDFWSPADGWQERFDRHYDALGLSIENCPRRIVCNQCCIALGGLKFFAKRADRAGYDWVRERIAGLLRAGNG